MREIRGLVLVAFVACGGAAVHTEPINRLDCDGPHALADSATGRLQGHVLDAVDERPLAGVTVSVSGPASRTTTTDGEGDWRLANLPEGEYAVAMSVGDRLVYSSPVDLCPTDVLVMRTPVWQ